MATGNVVVPDVTGLSCDEATAKMKQRTLVATCQDQPSDQPVGKAFNSTPAVGATAPQNSSVTVLISSGPQQVTVPPVVGETKQDAVKALHDVGLKAAITQGVECTDPGLNNTIQSQNPTAGHPGRPGHLRQHRRPQVPARRPELREPAADMTEVAPLRVIVLSGGRSSEHEISIGSGESVSAALDPVKYDVVGVTISREGAWQLEEPAAEGERLALDPGSSSNSVIPRAGGTLSKVRAVGPIDVVIPMLHGPFGEDGTVQGMLELLDVPYVGSGVLASALTMDKDKVKTVLAAAGIQCAKSVTFRAQTVHDVDVEAELAKAEIGVPCFVKPARLGSSVGISKVTGIDGLRPALDLAFQHDSKVLVEEMVRGIEAECGVLGNHNPMVSVVGRLHVNADWYDYAAKYEPGGMDLEAPADLPEEVTAEVQRVALLAFEVCECAGMARIDFFITDEGGVVVNEINTIPGFTETSVYARLFEASGITYPDLLDRLVDLAIERHREDQQFRH